MRTRRLALSSALLCLLVAGCGSKPDPSGQDDPAGSAPSSAHPGTLAPDDFALARKVAEEYQAKVAGEFVGATAAATGYADKLDPINLDDHCKTASRFLVVRIVWDSANFDHSGLVGGGPPDGPRKAQLITVLPGSGHLCEAGAIYRDVGAASDETLLYGAWPDPADS